MEDTNGSYMTSTNKRDDPHQCPFRKKKRKSTNLPTHNAYDDRTIFDCPLMKSPLKDTVQYLYADPVFQTQANNNNNNNREKKGIDSKDEEDQFFDCSEGEEDLLDNTQQPANNTYKRLLKQQQQKMIDIINNIEDPKQFKLLMKEVAYTSDILYRSFKKAYHKAKKPKKKNKGSTTKSSPKRCCDECCHQKHHKSKTGGDKNEEPCGTSNLCNIPKHVPDMELNGTHGMQVKCENDACVNAQNQRNYLTSMQSVKVPDTKSCDLPMATADMRNLCNKYDQDYEGLSFCERCAKLRGEPVICEEIPQTVPDPSTLCPCGEFKFKKEVNEILNASTAGPQRVMKFEEKPILRTVSHVPTVKSEPSQIQSLPVLEPLLITCPKPATQQNTAISTILTTQQAALVKEPSAIYTCPYPKCSATQALANTPICAYQPSQPLQGLQNQYLQTCPTHFCCHQYQPTYSDEKMRPFDTAHFNLQTPSKNHKDKLSKKPKYIQMEPVFFSLPINLQIQNRNGETQYVQTEVTMEAYGEQEKRKHKPDKYDKEALKTPATATTTASTMSSCQTQTQKVTQEEQQTQVDIFGDVFHSCSSSSEPEMLSLKSNIPCESLVKVLDIIKQRVSKEKKVSNQLLKTMVSYNFQDCLSSKSLMQEKPQTLLPKVAPPTSEFMGSHKIEKQPYTTKLEEKPLALAKEDESCTRIPLKGPPPAPRAFKEENDRIPPWNGAVEPLPAHINQRINAIKTDETIIAKGRAGSLSSPAHIYEKLTLESSTRPTTKVSEAVQTDLTSEQVMAHSKRNELRREIKDNLNDLLRPSTSKTKNRYEPEEIDEILKDLHTIFNPQNAGIMTKEESRESVLEDIRLLLSPTETHKTTSTPYVSPFVPQSTKDVKKSTSAMNKLKDIGHILNPKSSNKPSKHYTKEQREQMLQDLHKVLEPRSHVPREVHEPRDSVLQDLRYLLDGNFTNQTSSSRQTPTSHVRDSVLNDLKYLLDKEHITSSSTDDDGQTTLKKPKPPPKPTRNEAFGSSLDDFVIIDPTTKEEMTHSKRNKLRKEIKDNLNDLLGPSTPKTKKKYEPEEIDEILKDLHMIFNPQKTNTRAREETRDSVLDDIRLLLSPSDTHQTTSTAIPSVPKSKTDNKKSSKSKKKPSKQYTKEQRDQMLQDLHKLVEPRSQHPHEVQETRDSVLYDLRYLLEGNIVGQTSSSRQKPTGHVRDSVINDIKYLLDGEHGTSSDDDGQTTSKAPKPLSKPTRPKELPSSSDEEATAKQRPPVPKKPQH